MVERRVSRTTSASRNDLDRLGGPQRLWRAPVNNVMRRAAAVVGSIATLTVAHHDTYVEDTTVYTRKRNGPRRNPREPFCLVPRLPL